MGRRLLASVFSTAPSFVGAQQIVNINIYLMLELHVPWKMVYS